MPGKVPPIIKSYKSTQHSLPESNTKFKNPKDAERLKKKQIPEEEIVKQKIARLVKRISLQWLKNIRQKEIQTQIPAAQEQPELRRDAQEEEEEEEEAMQSHGDTEESLLTNIAVKYPQFNVDQWSNIVRDIHSHNPEYSRIDILRIINGDEINTELGGSYGVLFISANRIKNKDYGHELNYCIEYLRGNISRVFRRTSHTNIFEKIMIFFGLSRKTCEVDVVKMCIWNDIFTFYDQQNVGNCVFIVNTRLTIKIIELIYICKTGNFLGNIEILNIVCMKNIFTMNNIFIMQFLGDEDSQLKFIFFLAKENYVDGWGYNLCEFFMYIYIYFYLFMYILSVLDDMLKRMSTDFCKRVDCRLTYTSLIPQCGDTHDLETRSISTTLEYSLIDRYINVLFTTQPSVLIATQLREGQGDEGQGSIIQNCIENLTSIGLDENSIRKICIDSALNYIPENVKTFLDSLWGIIRPERPITFEKFVTFEIINRAGDREVHHWEYITSKGLQNIYDNDDKIDPRVPGSNIGSYGNYIYQTLLTQARNTFYKIIYISIHIKLSLMGNKISSDPDIRDLFISKGVNSDTFDNLFNIDEGDIHSSHALSILFIFDEIYDRCVIRIMNSWGDCATHMDLTPDLFIWLLNNDIIFSLTWFHVLCGDNQLMGGKNTKKIRRNKRNIKRSNQCIKRSNKRNIKRSNRCIKKSNKRTNKRKIR